MATTPTATWLCGSSSPLATRLLGGSNGQVQHRIPFCGLPRSGDKTQLIHVRPPP